MKNRNLHTTNDELVYIRQIGQFNTKQDKPSRRVMLQNYLKAMPLRVNWNGMDKDLIEVHARLELERCG